MSDEQEAGAVGQAWLVRRVVTGHGVGMRWEDDRLSDTAAVFMTLWCHDLVKPGHFAMEPDHAEALATALLDSAQKAREAAL